MPMTMKRLITVGTIVLLFAGSPRAVFALAAPVTLSKFGIERLIGLSTVLFVCMIVVATVLMSCWNRLIAGMNWPRLTHPKAIGFTFLGGLPFFLILVMIDGILYELSDKPQPEAVLAFDPVTLVPLDDSPEARLVVRRESLARLRDALWKYADENGGNFPETLPQHLQTIPVSGGVKYQYHVTGDDVYCVLEPDIHEPPQLGLTRQGTVVALFNKEVQQ